MRAFLILIMINYSLSVEAWGKKPEFSARDKAIIDNLDSFFDPEYDYSRFTGRMTDRDASNNTFKVSSEDPNIRLLQTGDEVEFNVASVDTSRCVGHVRSIERHYFVMHVANLFPCWEKDNYFRRGTMLVFKSVDLASRVREASAFRLVLIKRRKDFFRQLSKINHFVWTFDQQKVLLAAEYDKKIMEIKKGQQRALEMLLSKKKDSIYLQKELARRLRLIDKDLAFYRIEKSELMYDRWHLDHDMGIPVGRKPQAPKKSKVKKIFDRTF